MLATEQRLLTPEQIVDQLQVSLYTIKHWLRRGQLKGLKVGRAWRIRPRDLEVFLEQSSEAPAPPPSSN